jgi:hypothetical protein
MNKLILSKVTLTIAFLFTALLGYSQSTTLSTNLGGATGTAAASGAIVFGVTNANTYPIAITQLAVYHNHIQNNGRTYTYWYTSSQLTGLPTVNAANGWIQGATSPAINASASAITTIFTNQYLVIPPNTTYRIAMVVNSGNMYFSTTGNNTYSAGNVTIQTGSSTVSPGYAGTMPSPNLTPRFFSGSITFVQADPNNIGIVSMLSPTPSVLSTTSTHYCYNANTPVKVVITNMGSISQSNFKLFYKYTGSTTVLDSMLYTNTLAPFAKDTVVIGYINPAPGTYTLRAYTQLSADTVKVNDTTPAVTIIIKTPVQPPVTVSDTVCPGSVAYISVNAMANNTYKWYSAQVGGSLVNIGNNVTFTPLVQDTVMYVSAVFDGCESVRNPISAIVSNPPAINLGADTIFCESIPLILDAGNLGGTYLWSTGDTTQTIAITNVSGTYWVEVDKYCKNSDTVGVTIAPQPHVSGISYIRMGNTYYFQPSSVQNVPPTGYHWYFGDGAESTDSTPVHTYGPGISVALVVKLVVTNSCGDDTAFRSVPTAIGDIQDWVKTISIYPNPATSQLTIQSSQAVVEEAYFLNALGSMVLKKQLSGRKSNTVDISSLAPGNYILHLRTDKGDLNQPIQIVK